MWAAFMTMLLTAPNIMAQDSISEGKTTLPDKEQVKEKTTQKKKENGTLSGMKVNGRPATAKERQKAKQMVRQTGKMVGQVAQIATSALVNPDTVEQLSDELEQMGAELEQMGDELEALADDTTYYYEGNDSIDEMDDEDLDELLGLGEYGNHFNWLGGLFAGGLGIFAIITAFFVLAFLFFLFTSPLWILGLILLLIIRSGHKKTEKMAGSQAVAGSPISANPSASAKPTASAKPSVSAKPVTASNTLSAEMQRTWQNGIKQSFLGVGLIIFFYILGWKVCCGIGALVLCIGIAKLVIVLTSKNHYSPTVIPPQQESFVTGVDQPASASEQPAAENDPHPAQEEGNTYNKQENL